MISKCERHVAQQFVTSRTMLTINRIYQIYYAYNKKNLPEIEAQNLRLFSFSRSHFDLSEPTVLHGTHESPLLQETARSRS